MSAIKLKIFLFILMFLAVCSATHGSQNTTTSKEDTGGEPNTHGVDYQVYPVLRLKLTSSVLPAAIQMLTSYIEKLEDLQRQNEDSHQQQQITSSKPPHSITTTTTSTMKPTTSSTTITETISKPSVVNTNSSNLSNQTYQHQNQTNTIPNKTSSVAHTSSTIPQTFSQILNHQMSTTVQPISTSTQYSTTESSISSVISSTKPPQTSSNQTSIDIVNPLFQSSSETINEYNTSTNETSVEEIDNQNELFTLTTTTNDITDITTESLFYTSTIDPSKETSTNVYEINVNEEIVVDIDLLLGKRDEKVNETVEGAAEEAIDKRTMKSDKYVAQPNWNVQKNKATNMEQQTITTKRIKHLLSNSVRSSKNKSNTHKIKQTYMEYGRNKTDDTNKTKTSNMIRNKLQNIMAQKNKPNNCTEQKVNGSQQTLNQLEALKNITNEQKVVKNTTTKAASTTMKKKEHSNQNKIGTTNRNDEKTQIADHHILVNHMKESHFNKSADDLFMKTINDIVDEQTRRTHDPNKPVLKSPSSGSAESSHYDLVNRFWTLAQFFSTLQHFLGDGSVGLFHHTASPDENKEVDDEALDHVSTQLTVLKILFNVEAKDSRMWRYHGYSKSATKFLISTSNMSASEQLKITLKRLIDRRNIKHKKTIDATQKIIEQLNDPSSNMTLALGQVASFRFT